MRTRSLHGVARALGTCHAAHVCLLAADKSGGGAAGVDAALPRARAAAT